MRGTVTKRPDGAGRARWAYVFDAGKNENGKRKQLTKSGFETKRDAEDALAKAIAAHHEKSNAPAPKTIPTFAEFFERWHSECVKRECSPKTSERMAELGAYAIRLIGDMPLDKLDTMLLATAMNRLADRGGRKTEDHPQGRPLAPKTISHIMFTTQRCLQQAVDWEIIPKNPMLKVKKPKIPKRRPKVADRAGLDRLFKKTAGTRLYPFLVLAASTGCRRGELLALEWPDMNWDTATLEVSKSLEETKQGLRIKTTKSGLTRRFTVPAAVLDALQEHRREQERCREMYGPDYANPRLVFATPEGNYYVPKKYSTRVALAMRAAGLAGLSLHSLRHSHASQLLNDGVPITSVSERLGHASPQVTLSIYSHAMPLSDQAAAKVWNDAMADVIQKSGKEAAKRRALANVSAESKGEKLILLKSVG